MSDIQNEINKMKAEIMHDEIIIKYDFIEDIDKKSVINKIIELNFDENKIKDYYDNVQEIYDDIEYGYFISGILEKEVIINKIEELHVDRALIVEWVERVFTDEV